MDILLVLDGYNRSTSGTPVTETRIETQAGTQTEAQADAQTINQNGEKASQDQASESTSGAVSFSKPGSGDELNTGFDENKLTCQIAIRVGSLKGPTSMGLISLMGKASRGETSNVCEFTMVGRADELVGRIADGDLDTALLPASIASILYAKTQGDIAIPDINTLDVPYVVVSDDPISSTADLKGRTIYTTGKGTTPEYVINYLSKENGLSTSDVDPQFKSEATEMMSLLKQDSSAIGILPQPFATAACIQNPDLKTVLGLTEQWNMLNKDAGSMLVTGTALVRSDLLRENHSSVVDLIKNRKASILPTMEYAEDVSRLIAEQGIVEKTPIVQKALPYCSIVCLIGQEIKGTLNDYLSTLHRQGPGSTDGQTLEDDFYYMP